MTYLGPYPTIASLSLGTPRAFRLRPIEAVDSAFSTGRPTRTYEVQLAHNSLCLMTAGCQERYKHTVPPQRALDTFRPGWDAMGEAVRAGEGESYTTRINITFRFYRDGEWGLKRVSGVSWWADPGCRLPPRPGRRSAWTAQRHASVQVWYPNVRILLQDVVMGVGVVPCLGGGGVCLLADSRV